MSLSAVAVLNAILSFSFGVAIVFIAVFVLSVIRMTWFHFKKLQKEQRQGEVDTEYVPPVIREMRKLAEEKNSVNKTVKKSVKKVAKKVTKK